MGAQGGEFPVDGAWIHRVYARSLVREGPSRTTQGARAGFSSLLWVLSSVPAQLWRRSGPDRARVKLTSLAWAVAAAAGLGRVALALGASRAASLATVALAALSWGNLHRRCRRWRPSLAARLLRVGRRVAPGGQARACGSARRTLCARPRCAVVAAAVNVDALATAEGRVNAPRDGWAVALAPARRGRR